ncbi:MAG: hypothetical protein KC419_22530 [Anaerolineales bacterium]|nr:hypothetical protein [Anaerolineales bacterium]
MKSFIKTLGILQIFIGIGAVPVGLMFIVDPTGASLGFPLEWLADTLFQNYLVPGIFLFTVNGIGSLIGAFLTLRRHPSASLAAVGLGAFLMAWIVVQVITLGPPPHWLQILYFVLGAVELLLGWRINPNGGEENDR